MNWKLIIGVLVAIAIVVVIMYFLFKPAPPAPVTPPYGDNPWWKDVDVGQIPGMEPTPPDTTPGTTPTPPTPPTPTPPTPEPEPEPEPTPSIQYQSPIAGRMKKDQYYKTYNLSAGHPPTDLPTPSMGIFSCNRLCDTSDKCTVWSYKPGTNACFLATEYDPDKLTNKGTNWKTYVRQ